MKNMTHLIILRDIWMCVWHDKASTVSDLWSSSQHIAYQSEINESPNITWKHFNAFQFDCRVICHVDSQIDQISNHAISSQKWRQTLWSDQCLLTKGSNASRIIGMFGIQGKWKLLRSTRHLREMVLMQWVCSPRVLKASWVFFALRYQIPRYLLFWGKKNI